MSSLAHTCRRTCGFTYFVHAHSVAASRPAMAVYMLRETSDLVCVSKSQRVTCSRAREIQRGSRDSEVLKEFPLGLPTLSGPDKDRVMTANAIYDGMTSFLLEAQEKTSFGVWKIRKTPCCGRFPLYTHCLRTDISWTLMLAAMEASVSLLRHS